MEIRPVGADDLEQELDLRVRAFGPLGGFREQIVADNLAQMAAEQMLGAYDGDRLIGTARYHVMRQWWGGRDLPMAGVSGVKVAPEARGQGVATALLTELLPIMTQRGYPISVLYPTTPGVYRALGWEWAGGFYRSEIAARALTALLPPDSGVTPSGRAAGLRRAGPDDADQAVAVMSAVHAASRASGPTAFDVETMRRDLADDDELAYLADDGFISYGFDGGSRAIEVSYLAIGSAATAAAIWGILGSHSTVTRTVGAFVSPSDPIGLLLKHGDIEVRLHKRSMLRVIDPVAAVAGRGFPVAVTASANFRLTDAAMPANSGDYRLTVADGTGSLVKVVGQEAGEPLVLGARGFAALFAGVPMTTLRTAGLASGGDATTDALLGAAFACTPYMTDSF
ncbi:MAG TPA: GNAT family N-acetyltransferase [Streptosporangiaceae bacterium]|nr:GNAT family N-acetyltransferase [Streptosporangiaceae bacterium]